jgi:hypothetical protein
MLSQEEQAIRLWDMEEVKDLVARRAYYVAGNRRREELNDLWVQDYYNRLSASYGSNWGFYVGMRNIAQYYVTDHTEKEMAKLKANADADPAIAVNNLNKGYGNASHHTLNTGHVHIAADGKTARGLFYDMSLDSQRLPDGTTDAYVNLGPVAVDCIKENGRWKIWHLFVGYDHCLPIGEDYSAIPVVRPAGTHPYEEEFGTPTVPMKTYDPDFGWGQDFVEPPTAYTTFNSAHSYGPEGHPKFQEELL